MNCSILQIQSNHSSTLAILHEQIHCKVFDKIVAIVTERLAIKRVQKRMSSSVSYAAASMSLSSLAVVVTLSAKSTLINFTVGCARKRHAIVFQLNNGFGCFSGHVMNCVLISKPIGPLDGVIHVPLPIVVLHIPESGIDSSLGSYCVRTCREEFCDNCGLETFSYQTKGSTETSSTLKQDIYLLIKDL